MSHVGGSLFFRRTTARVVRAVWQDTTALCIIAPCATLPSPAQGVGPATASAVLQAFHPSIPFMSDEAMMAALGEKAYTIPIALEFIKTLREKAAELNKLDAERE